jgi:hypothetical protein
MSDEEFEAFKAEADRLERECNTPELATRQLQLEGILDENGELAAPYRASAWL